MSGFSAKTREIVYARADRCCEREGCGVYAYGGSVHHRRARGMGGDKRSTTDRASNAILLCGSGTTGCHGWVEQNRATAIEAGLLVPSTLEPAEIPVTLRYGRVLLHDDGTYGSVPWDNPHADPLGDMRKYGPS